MNQSQTKEVNRSEKSPEHKLVLIRFCTLLLLLPAFLANADESNAPEWELHKDKKGIQVYSRKINGLKYKEFKGVVEIEATLAGSLALLEDSDACVDWLYRCQSSRVLQRSGILERHVYQVSNLPFPAATRDSIFKARLLEYRVGLVRVGLLSVPDFVEETSYVRIQDAYGTYLLEALDEQHLRLTWVQYINPAGVLPAFLVNSLLTDVPFKSLKKFREVVKREKYRNARFVYDESGTPIDLLYGVTSK